MILAVKIFSPLSHLVANEPLLRNSSHPNIKESNYHHVNDVTF